MATADMSILILYRRPSTPFCLFLCCGQRPICIFAEEHFALNDAFSPTCRTSIVKPIGVVFDVLIVVAAAIAAFAWWTIVIEPAEENYDYDAEKCENGQRQEADQRAIQQSVTDAVVEEYSACERHDERRDQKERWNGVEFDAHVGSGRCRIAA